MYLPDINFWLALAFQSHEHHASAKAWMSSAAARSCFFCRLTQQGFLRLSTNRKVFPLAAVSMNKAWELYDGLCVDIHVGFVDEPEGIEASWRALTQSSRASTNVWSDA